MVCASAQSVILVPPKFCFVGCKESALPRALRVWISTPSRRHSWSVCTAGSVTLASMDEIVLAALVEPTCLPATSGLEPIVLAREQEEGRGEWHPASVGLRGRGPVASTRNGVVNLKWLELDGTS